MGNLGTPILGTYHFTQFPKPYKLTLLAVEVGTCETAKSESVQVSPSGRYSRIWAMLLHRSSLDWNYDRGELVTIDEAVEFKKLPVEGLRLHERKLPIILGESMIEYTSN